MAIVKHIKSRNANYSAAINYLLFEHDEKTGKKRYSEIDFVCVARKSRLGGIFMMDNNKTDMLL